VTQALTATAVTWGIVNAVIVLLALDFQLSPVVAIGRALPLALVCAAAAGLFVLSEQRGSDRPRRTRPFGRARRPQSRKTTPSV